LIANLVGLVLADFASTICHIDGAAAEFDVAFQQSSETINGEKHDLARRLPQDARPQGSEIRLRLDGHA